MRSITVKKGWIVTFLASVLACLCGNAPDTRAASQSAKIVMNRTGITLSPGGTFKMKVKKIKVKKLGKSVIYRSLGKKVATVNSRGLVKAKKAGRAKIVIISRRNRKIRTTVIVTVKDKKIVNSQPRVSQEPQNTVVPDQEQKTSEPSADKTLQPTVSPAPVLTPTPPPEQTPMPDTKGFDQISDMYLDMISEQFPLMLTDGTVDTIALDLTDCKSMTDADRQALADQIKGKYGKEAVQKTFAQLKEEGSIVDDSTYGFVFAGGVLITVSETEKDASGYTFQISCVASGLSAKHFTDCKALLAGDKWTYELGGKIQA